MASGFPSVHQRKLGPAPIASFEDLSDEVENGGDPVHRMPGIIEVITPATPANSLKTPSTPRIDISRASSSSQHEEEESNSRESTPEKELLAGMEPPAGSKIVLGFKEDAQDLRSSTEELELHDPIHHQDLRREIRRCRKRARELHDGTQSEYGVNIKINDDRERKDSNCSEIILLNISGRTSRLSSVGSQGSGVSGNASVLSANSSRSPSPHKCLLETSFCGSVSALANTYIEPSKPDTDDLAKILLQREEDSTRAMIPESIRVPIVAGNIKPDPIDMPFRKRDREERKEIFKREVEITKKLLKRVNIEVPIIKLPKEAKEDTSRECRDFQKPFTLDLSDARKNSQSDSGYHGAALDTPKLTPHKKVRDVEGSPRTPSPNSVSRKSSFSSLFRGRSDHSNQCQDSPSSSTRRSLTGRLKDTADILRSRSKSRERPSSGEKSPGLRKDSRKSGSVFSSTLSLFRRQRKKSGGSIGTPDMLDGSATNLDSLGHVEFTFPQHYQSQTLKDKDSIFISLHGDDDERTNHATTLPTEDFSVALDSPKSPIRPYEDYESATSPEQQSAGTIVCTEASIEHHRRSTGSSRRSGDGLRISSSSGDSSRIPESRSRDSHLSRSDSKDFHQGNGNISHHQQQTRPAEIINNNNVDHMINNRKSSDIIKPKRKSKEILTSSFENQQQINGKNSSPIADIDDDVRNGESGLMIPPDDLSKAPSITSDLDRHSSESERESEVDFGKKKSDKEVDDIPDERKGLCYDESFEEDLPYVPTTLPLEKSVAIPIVPIKQRRQRNVRTMSIDRPRPTTAMNPAILDEFIMHQQQEEKQVEKMKISLPREDSFKLKSPHKNTSSFSEFAGLVPPSKLGLSKSPSPPPPKPKVPPPLPPRAPTTRLTNWINFEEIPEKRKAPKRIQTIPRLDDDSKNLQSGPASASQYSYVQPEECRCECHEESRRALQQREGVCNGQRCTSNNNNNNNNQIPTEGASDRASVVRGHPTSNSTARRKIYRAQKE